MGWKNEYFTVYPFPSLVGLERVPLPLITLNIQIFILGGGGGWCGDNDGKDLKKYCISCSISYLMLATNRNAIKRIKDIFIIIMIERHN